MKRITRQALERKLEQARRLSLEPTDLRTREQVAQVIEDLELQLHDRSSEYRLREQSRHSHYTGII